MFVAHHPAWTWPEFFKPRRCKSLPSSKGSGIAKASRINLWTATKGGARKYPFWKYSSEKFSGWKHFSGLKYTLLNKFSSKPYKLHPTTVLCVWKNFQNVFHNSNCWYFPTWSVLPSNFFPQNKTFVEIYFPFKFKLMQMPSAFTARVDSSNGFERKSSSKHQQSRATLPLEN